jgi:hypothetical protein
MQPFPSIRLFSMDACCFQCSVRTMKTRVSEMMETLPDGAWEEAVRPKLVLPVLRRLSLMDRLRRMPLKWLESDGLPMLCPRNSCLVVVRYWELCRMLKVGPGDNEVYFLTMHSLASNIMHIMVVRENQPLTHDEYTGLWHQISIISGADSIATELRDIVSRARSGRRLKIEGVVQHVERCGAVEYALFLADHMGRLLIKEDFRQQALDRLCDGLRKGLKREADKLHTLRMALHRRSGAGIKAIGSDLLRLCVAAVRTEKIVLWEEVLEKWLVQMPVVGAMV